MRIAAICLPELRVEVVRAAAPEERGPLAIVVSHEARAPMTEAKLLGNTRLDVVSREARALGVHAGQTIAQARARSSNLAVRVVRPDDVNGVLARLAEVALAFGATVSYASADGAVDSYGDIVWVDVTGCAHLHASDSPATMGDGEAVLAFRLARVIGGLGHVCSVAIADGPRIAAILSRMAPRMGDDEPTLVVVPPGKNGVALASLPVSALPIGADDARWLAKIGVRTIAELRALPRAALATRLGARASLLTSLAEGEDRAPLTPYVPPEIPEEEATLEYGVEGAEALTFVAKTLADRLATRLAGRAVAASRIELDLALDHALSSSSRGAGARRVQRIAIELPAPLSSASDLLAALRPKIERVVLHAPVLGAKLRAASLVHKPQAALSLFEPQPKAERALPRLVAELAADLGEEAVGMLVLGDAWIPEERSCFVRFGSASRGANSRRRRHMLASVPEPTRLLGVPLPVPRDAVKIVRHLSRLESVDWWRRLPGEGPKKGVAVDPASPGDARLRRIVDYVQAWVHEGPAWVEIDRATGAARVRGWFD